MNYEFQDSGYSFSEPSSDEDPATPTMIEPNEYPHQYTECPDGTILPADNHEGLQECPNDPVTELDNDYLDMGSAGGDSDSVEEDPELYFCADGVYVQTIEECPMEGEELNAPPDYVHPEYGPYIPSRHENDYYTCLPQVESICGLYTSEDFARGLEAPPLFADVPETPSIDIVSGTLALVAAAVAGAVAVKRANKNL
ncbi:TPA: hypothetical protein EYO12_00700 [Candidatus Saccharibacteria bacterium]|nr:hypothetical protein [Candidatus Saccharibacteria bacterium]HIO87614.1 hypothetical protein [Candidatus Saccharibacteria bacterium]